MIDPPIVAPSASASVSQRRSIASALAVIVTISVSTVVPPSAVTSITAASSQCGPIGAARSAGCLNASSSTRSNAN